MREDEFRCEDCEAIRDIEDSVRCGGDLICTACLERNAAERARLDLHIWGNTPESIREQYRQLEREDAPYS